MALTSELSVMNCYNSLKQHKQEVQDMLKSGKYKMRYVQVNGDNHNNTLKAGDTNCILEGGAGNDTLESSFFGSNILMGGIGNDTIKVNNNDFVFGDSEDDYIKVYSGNNWIEGGSGDDIIDFLPMVDGRYGSNDTNILAFEGDFGKDTITGQIQKQSTILVFDKIDGFEKQGEDLIIKSGNNQVTIKDYYSDPKEYRINHLVVNGEYFSLNDNLYDY